MQARTFQRIGIASLLLVLAAPFVGFILYTDWHPSLKAWDEHRVEPARRPDPEALTLTWLGVAGVHVRDGQTSVLVDPFFSRPPLSRVLFGKLQPNPERIRAGLNHAGIDEADAVIVTHTHYDHAMDAPWIARYFGAPLLGSPSTAEVARGQGLAEALIRTVEPGEDLRVGHFRIRFLASDHVPLPPLLARTMGTDRAIDSPLVVPARVSAWREGQQLALHLDHPDARIAILGSAGFRPEMAGELRADILLAATAALGNQSKKFHDAFVHHGVEAFRPDQVIPVHWDDMFQPLARNTPPLPLLLENVPATLGVLEQRLHNADQRLRLARPMEPMQVDHSGEHVRLRRTTAH